MLRLIALAALSMAMFVAAAAQRRGEGLPRQDDQGRAASVVIGSDGLLRTARVNWRARCRKSGRARDKTAFLRPHDESTPDAFADAGIYRRRDDDGYRLRFTVSVRGPGSPTSAASAGAARSARRSS